MVVSVVVSAFQNCSFFNIVYGINFTLIIINEKTLKGNEQYLLYISLPSSLTHTFSSSISSKFSSNTTSSIKSSSSSSSGSGSGSGSRSSSNNCSSSGSSNNTFSNGTLGCLIEGGRDTY